MEKQPGHAIMADLLKTVVSNTFRDINRNHTMAFAAALSYYFVLSLFPALILLAAVLVLLPIPNLFPQILNMISRVVPADAMGLVRQITSSVITPNGGILFSFGLLGVLWSASSGFAALIEALNVAYDVPETRSFWKTRLLALLMALGVGVMLLVALGFQVLGPDFGRWLAHRFGLGSILRVLWPYLRWGATLAFAFGAILATYQVMPNVRQRLSQVLPGAVLATVGWIVLSDALGIYFRSFAHFNKTYGTLGAAIVLMVWVYYTGFVVLIGAEFNSELMQLRAGGRLPLKQPPPSTVKPQPATESKSDVAA
jgi:membrane protein